MYTVTVQVSDGGLPPLATQAEFTVLVSEVNSPPYLPSPGDQYVVQGEPLTVTLAATDGDLPANGLAYYAIDKPSGASLDPVTGVFAWTPGLGQPAGQYPLRVRVFDSGAPPLFAETAFTITVTTISDLRLDIAQRASPVLLGATAYYTLTAANFGLYPVTGLNFTIDLPAGLEYLATGSHPGCTGAAASSASTAAPTGQQVTCGLPALNRQTAASIVLAARVVEPAGESGPLVVSASLSALQGDSNPANNQAEILTEVVRSQLVYELSPQVPGGGWSSNVLTSTAPNGQPFLGEFNNQSIELTLANLPDHSWVEVYFDLYILRSWNGNSRSEPLDPSTIPVGPDVWLFEAQTQTRLQTSFSNYPTGFQSFPGAFPFGSYPGRSGAFATGSLGYTFNGLPGMDTIYRLGFRFPDSASTLWLRFRDMGLQAIDNESWGIANLRVTVDGGQLFYHYLPAINR